MNRRNFLSALAACLIAVSLCGCIRITGKPEAGTDQSRYDDAGIKTAIASALLKKDASKANDVSVHCFNGHVFLIGEADKDFRAEAMDVARKEEGVAHVTTHWFPNGTASTLQDATLEAEIDSRLLFTEDINTRRLAVDVWGGHVVLTGLAKSQAEINGAVAKIKAISGVKSVTTYVALS